MPPEAHVLESRDDPAVVQVVEQVREEAPERLPPTGMNRLAVGARLEHERRPDVEEVCSHHRNDDEENQNRFGEDVTVCVVAERHPRLVFDRLRVTAVLATLHPPQVEEHERAHDRGERGELLDERIHFAEQVVGAQQAPEIEADIEPAPPEHEAIEKEHHEGDEDAHVRETRQRIVGHPLLAKDVDQEGLRPIGNLFTRPRKTRVGHANLELPQPPKHGP